LQAKIETLRLNQILWYNILKLNALRCKFHFAVKNSYFAGRTSKHFG
jgi:hypothetical protein